MEADTSESTGSTAPQNPPEDVAQKAAQEVAEEIARDSSQPTSQDTTTAPVNHAESNGASVDSSGMDTTLFPGQDQAQAQAQDTNMLPIATLQPDEQTILPNITPQPMSADEIALYDRQIRLWGLPAQEMIRTSNILLIGMKALGNEVAKNLVLAGIGSLTILDHETVTEEDLSAQFLVTENDIGKNRAEAAATELRKMNPRVNIFADPDMVINKMQEYFVAFNVVIMTDQSFAMASTINMNFCRTFGIKFYAAETHGLYGYVFADLVMHQFVIEKEQGNIATKEGLAETPFRMVLGVTTKKENDKTIEIVTKQEMYSPLMLSNLSPLPMEAVKNRRTKLKVTPLISCLRALFEFQKNLNRLPAHTRQDLEVYTKLAQDKHLELGLPAETLSASFLRSFMQNLGTELTPTAAFLGGELAQDVINVLSQREQPLQNILFFDGEEFKAPVYSMHPIFDAGLVMDDTMSAEQTTLPVMNGMPAAEA